MKTISLSVTDSFVLPEWFSTASPNDIENALQFAAYSSTSAWKLVYSNNLDHEKEKLHSIQIDNDKNYNTKLVHLEELYNSKMQSLVERECILEKSFAQLHNEAKTIETALLEYVNKPINDISEKFDSLMGKKNSAFSNSDKGNFGQSFISEQVVKYFPSAEIIDTHSQDHYGDIHIKIDEFLFMIESKNKKAIDKSDVDKFSFDVNFLKNNIHGALFISLKENVPVPTKGHISCEFINGIPVIYTTSGFNKPDVAIYTGIQFLLGIVNMNEYRNFQNDIQKMNEELSKVSSGFDEFMKINEDNLKLANNIVTNCNKQKRDFLDLSEFFTKINKFNSSSDTQSAVPTHSSNTNLTFVKNLIADFQSENNGKNPTRKYLLSKGVTHYFLKHHPMSELLTL